MQAPCFPAVCVNDALRSEYAAKGVAVETLRISAAASVDAYIEYRNIVGSADGGVLLSGAPAARSGVGMMEPSQSPVARGGVRSLPRACSRARCRAAVRVVAQPRGARLQGTRC